MTESPVMEGPSGGALLRQAREAAGLHVAALAVSLKVPVRKIEALEQERWDELPDAVFARALASSVCRTLKVDPQPILQRLPQGNVPRLAPDRDGINAPFRAPGDAPPATWRNQLTRPVSLVVIALLVGALVILFMPDFRREETVAAKPEAAPGVPMAAVVTQPVATDPAAAASSSGAAAQPPAAAAPVTVTEAPAPVTTTVAPAAATVALGAPSQPLPAAQPPADSVPTTGTVVFKTRAASWVEVTDAKGAVALRRLMGPGETAGASGNPPLTVTVGSARDTVVEVRGKPYDLGPVSKDNVARFEVK